MLPVRNCDRLVAGHLISLFIAFVVWDTLDDSAKNRAAELDGTHQELLAARWAYLTGFPKSDLVGVQCIYDDCEVSIRGPDTSLKTYYLKCSGYGCNTVK